MSKTAGSTAVPDYAGTAVQHVYAAQLSSGECEGDAG
jgi:hypothetical protein